MIKFKSHVVWNFFALMGLFAIVMSYQNCGVPEGRSKKPSLETYDADGEKPIIVSDLPSAGRTSVGGRYMMSVQATGDGTLTYKWYHDDILIMGEDENSLLLDPVEQDDEGVYRVRVGLVGEGFTDSRELDLTVEDSGDTTCTANQIVVNGACQNCPAGESPNNGKTACVAGGPNCTANQIVVNGACQNCPAGESPNNGRTACVAGGPNCTANQIVVNGACQNCPPGESPNNGRTACVAGGPNCTANQIVVNGACQGCPPGQRPNNGRTACVAGGPNCTANQIVVNGACQNCPSGQRPNNGKTACVSTGGGPNCTANQIVVNGACQNCPSGQRPNNGKTACEAITCTGQNQILSGNTCRTCPSGKKPNAQKTNCICNNPTKANLKTRMARDGYKNVEDDPCDRNCNYQRNRTVKIYDVRSGASCTPRTLVFYKSCERRPTKATLKSTMRANGFTRNSEDHPCVNSSNGCLIRRIRGLTTEGTYYPSSGGTCVGRTLTFYKYSTTRRGLGMGEFFNYISEGCITTTRQTKMCENYSPPNNGGGKTW